jgi:curli production assembly/transport component CsgG
MKLTIKKCMLTKHLLCIARFVLAILLITSCVPYISQPLTTQRARLGPETLHNKELTSLPAPKDKIVTAVYKFRDQTGQYKPSETGASWSTAISQGTTAILLRALEESNWFIVVERENVSNLLNERKIIRSSRAQFSGEKEENTSALPPLLFAGIILEGGIVSYETNILTGGIGLRYFGTGGSSQYRQDMVTVYLRAISTTNGKILKTVYTSKTILSQEVSIGIFRYVKLKKLLEAETGFTYNEPSEMAVTEAIEKAVIALILEGQQDGFWNFANLADSASSVVTNYKKEKIDNENLDLFNNIVINQNSGKFIIHAAGGINKFDGDHKGATIQPYGMIGFGYKLNPKLSANIKFERLELSSGKHFETPANIYSAGLYYKFWVAEITPFMEFGMGIAEEAGDKKYSHGRLYGTGYYGVGLEWFATPSLAIRANVSHNILFTDKFDALERGRYPDMIWIAGMGINIYLGNKK